MCVCWWGALMCGGLRTVQTRGMKMPEARNFALAIVITFPLISTGTQCVHIGRCQSTEVDNTRLEKGIQMDPCVKLSFGGR